ncbi:aminoglycoside adenylyltransferase domain-containing protein [Kribbella sp.]|uniref:aminoglycoside adenylyltransferase domain-containing protein n=1 Tax=Kribbella sp. TaxID=1871183 RepID=UPI002D4BA2DC|nr:aminoglycoside adenylyltransferase domain-containing protein [Kribbella sp.]HZX06004.1 aminoglycoside adenylyltransferase domain-containing protein [Kribbella sp.]
MAIAESGVVLPGAVRGLCERFLGLVEEELPAGLLTGLYLHGGVVFGEWVPRESDVDYLATLRRRPEADEVEALRRVHEQMVAYSPIRFDGQFVLAEDLAEDPRTLPPTPASIHTREFVVGHSPTLIIVWHELARAGITVTGPDLSTLKIWTDEQALREYTVNNLDTYWRGNAEGLTRATPADLPVDKDERDALLSHCILASVRLHHLLVTGEMTAKCRAGRWALTQYDERWHRVLEEGLHLREGSGVSQYVDETELMADTRDLLVHVVETTTGKPVVG